MVHNGSFVRVGSHSTFVLMLLPQASGLWWLIAYYDTLIQKDSKLNANKSYLAS